MKGNDKLKRIKDGKRKRNERKEDTWKNKIETENGMEEKETLGKIKHEKKGKKGKEKL